MLPKDLERWHDPDAHPYHLVPECRVCYALFASTADLRAHLQAKPSHDRRFRFKRRNELAPGVSSLSRRTCRTCALDCRTLDDWEHHNEQTGHYREDMIPLWKEDNQWWDDLCYDAKMFNSYGHLGAKVA